MDYLQAEKQHEHKIAVTRHYHKTFIIVNHNIYKHLNNPITSSYANEIINEFTKILEIINEMRKRLEIINEMRKIFKHDDLKSKSVLVVRIDDDRDDQHVF